MSCHQKFVRLIVTADQSKFTAGLRPTDLKPEKTPRQGGNVTRQERAVNHKSDKAQKIHTTRDTRLLGITKAQISTKPLTTKQTSRLHQPYK